MERVYLLVRNRTAEDVAGCLRVWSSLEDDESELHSLFLLELLDDAHIDIL